MTCRATRRPEPIYRVTFADDLGARCEYRVVATDAAAAILEARARLPADAADWQVVQVEAVCDARL